MVKVETQGLVSKAFRGSFMSLANYLINSDSLTTDDITELKTLIEKREAELRNNNND